MIELLPGVDFESGGDVHVLGAAAGRAFRSGGMRVAPNVVLLVDQLAVGVEGRRSLRDHRRTERLPAMLVLPPRRKYLHCHRVVSAGGEWCLLT
jgi:hypothetical protein